MVNYLWKLLILIVFAWIIIYNYYVKFPVHIEKFDWYMSYIIIISIIYWIYKFFTIKFNKEKVVFTPLELFLYFLLNLLILSSLFFTLSQWSFTDWFILFFKIISYSILPLFIIVLSTSFWYKLLWNIKTFNEESSIFKYLSSLWLWFFSFLFLIAIFWSLGIYNLYLIFSILILFIWFSYKEFLSFFNFLFTYRIEFKNHNFETTNFIENISPKLLTSEFLFIIATFLLSVNLISIVRPFPIGWDDLWAYMNYPRILAWSWTLEVLWWMFSWQSFTGIWFMFNSPNQAFFFNAVWGFMSFIVLILVIKDLLFDKEKKEETYINIPLLIATIFISMPMVIFQQAKDMKLDPGLFFVSLISLYMFYYLFKWYFRDKEKKEKINKTRLIYFVIIGTIAWLAFTIKFTSLMLISGMFWALFFIRLWVAGFLGYLSIYFALFTWAWLWKYMNVIFPKDDYDFRKNFFIFWMLVWILLLSYSKHKYKKRFDILLLKLWALILWILIALLPWVWKNLYQAGNISIWAVLSWKTKSFNVDYGNIYTDSELKVIEDKSINIWLNSSWTTFNEDLWRYFGYEKWVNNYLKLPWNLTMQKNQGWEFTDITFIFLALLPALFLFLPYRRREYAYTVAWILLFELSLFVFSGSSLFLTKFMTGFNLPIGYIVIFSAFIFFLLFRYILVKWEKNVKLFKLNLIFTIFYTFLWTISAFWIVWYGIMMYFGFLFMIAVCIYYLSRTDESSLEKERIVKFWWSIVVIIIVWIHFFYSTIPHWFNNLKNAWYKEFKVWEYTSDEAIFTYHREYLKILFELNISEEKRKEFIANNVSKLLLQELSRKEELKHLVPVLLSTDINNIISVLTQIWQRKSFPLSLKVWADKSKKALFSWILRPKGEYVNNVWIYRIGTFLKYFIYNNTSRLVEDSLVVRFDKYMYDENSDITVERIKKIWLKYFLVDLNAATIDKDPRHDLTRRYETLLETFTSDKLELVETDSMCLMLALENYKKSDKSEQAMKDYLLLAGVNYESYLADWSVVGRWVKLWRCYETIFELIKWNKINDKNYNFLLNVIQYLNKPEYKWKINTAQDMYNVLSRVVSHWYKVLFKVK